MAQLGWSELFSAFVAWRLSRRPRPLLRSWDCHGPVSSWSPAAAAAAAVAAAVELAALCFCHGGAFSSLAF